jgi:uncharacterized membrane protein
MQFAQQLALDRGVELLAWRKAVHAQREFDETEWPEFDGVPSVRVAGFRLVLPEVPQARRPNLAPFMVASPHPQSLTAADHKTVSRIESFSDIVFGFSLFNLALNLKPPAVSSDLVAQAPQFAVFIATFAVLCSIWWLHHRLFRDFFKPDGAGVILNFALLAAVAMFTYPLQLFMRFGAGETISFAGYAVGGGLVYGLTSILLAKGLFQLGETVGTKRRAEGVILATRLAIIAASMIVALFFYSSGTDAMGLTIIVGVVVSTIVRIIQRKAIHSELPTESA